MLTVVDQYIADKKLAWRPSSLRNERYRLRKWAPFITGKPEDLWSELERQEIQPYSRSTVFTRVCDFYQWMLDTGTLPNALRGGQEPTLIASGASATLFSSKTSISAKFRKSGTRKPSEGSLR